jgi:hypothetical protein
VPGLADYTVRNGSVSVGSSSRHPNAHGGLAHRAAGACGKHGGAAALRWFTQPPPPTHSRSAAARQAHAALRRPHQRGACVKGARVRCAFANQPPCALEEQQALTCLRYALVQRDVLDVSDAVSLPGAVANSVRESARRESAGRARHVAKADRATVEQALDPRTRLVREAARRRAT